MYLCIFAVRFLLILVFRPLFRLSRQDLSYKEILFATVAGLRGSVSLILAQAVVADPVLKADDVQTIVSALSIMKLAMALGMADSGHVCSPALCPG